MIYAARADLEARFGADEIARLADTGDDGAARMDAALADAAAAIEAMLREAFEAPLPDGSYPLLTAVACDLARERLYDDKAPEAVTARAELARASLTDIATDDDAREPARSLRCPVPGSGSRSRPTTRRCRRHSSA